MKQESRAMSKTTTFDKMRTGYLDAVKSSFSKGDLDILQKKFNLFAADDADKKSALDQVLRDFLLDRLASASLKKKSADNVNLWEKYVSFCISACKRALCSPTMPVVLLGDVFDALTLEQCERLFAYVEDNVSMWKEEMFFTPCKNNLLRMCNDLLRRLSRSQNTVFCGRILLFLAKFFPFSERSGLNVVSEFNLENVTEYGAEGSEPSKEENTEDGNDEDCKGDMKISIDYNLYSKFWSLQDFFRNPNQCYSKMSWNTFSFHTSCVLSAFSSFKLEEVADYKRQKLDSTTDKKQSNRMEVDGSVSHNTSSSQVFFAKFLTNQKLLELQLSDSNFRRYVLLQFLILFQYLDSQVKFKAENFELKPDQIEWLKATTETIHTLISETPPDGPDFLRAVKHILKREEQWSNWKNEGCKEFQLPGGNQKSAEVADEHGGSERKRPLKARKRGKPLGDLIKEATAQKKTFMGNAELTKLWNVCPDNLEACRGKDRDFLPSLDAYFEEAIEQTDPTAMVEDSYKKINDGNFGWRALRLLSRRSPHFFTLSSNNISKLPEYLETMIRKIAKDRPSTGIAATLEEVKEVLEGQAEENVADNEQEEDELLKTIKDDDNKDDDTDEKKPLSFNTKMLDLLAESLSSVWQKVATKVGYASDEIEMFSTGTRDETASALKWLMHYVENDEDASPENFAYTLEGLGLTEAVSIISDMDQ